MKLLLTKGTLALKINNKNSSQVLKKRNQFFKAPISYLMAHAIILLCKSIIQKIHSYKEVKIKIKIFKNSEMMQFLLISKT
jgi:hypothetical protein